VVYGKKTQKQKRILKLTFERPELGYWLKKSFIKYNFDQISLFPYCADAIQSVAIIGATVRRCQAQFSSFIFSEWFLSIKPKEAKGCT